MLGGVRGVGRKTSAELTQFIQPLDWRLARLADRQHGVVSLGQLETLGLSASAVRMRVAAGRLHRVHQGVYAVGRARLDVRGRWMAAVIACGRGAVLSHRTAAAAHGLLGQAGGSIDVTVPSRSPRRRPGVRVHRSPGLRTEDVTTVGGIPCTTVARTLLDLAAVLNARTLARALEAAERRRVFDGNAVAAQLARANGRPEASRLQAAMADYQEPPPTREEFERRGFEVLAHAGLGRPAVNVLIEVGSEQLEVDFCWPDRRLIVEFDSWEFHKTRAAFERDRRRDQLLRAAGWTVVRITWRQLTRAPHEVVAALKVT
jgi:predicted transcriptional regulator of viral defense system